MKVYVYSDALEERRISGVKMLSMLGAPSTDQQELLKSVNEKLEARPTPR